MSSFFVLLLNNQCLSLLANSFALAYQGSWQAGNLVSSAVLANPYNTILLIWSLASHSYRFTGRPLIDSATRPKKTEIWSYQFVLLSLTMAWDRSWQMTLATSWLSSGPPACWWFLGLWGDSTREKIRPSSVFLQKGKSVRRRLACVNKYLL